MNDFNPYRDWLKVLVDSDHPNYYQLLDLSPQDCGRRELVVAAARGQLEKLKLVDAGQNRAALESLVGEIKAAVKCLSSVAARREYDNSLGQTNVAHVGENQTGRIGNNPVDPPEMSNAARFRASTDAAIPEAIPLAIPITDSNSGNVAWGQTLDVKPIESIPVQDSPENSHLVVARKTRKRKSRLVFWSGHAVVLIAAVATLILLRPDVRERIFGGTPSPSSSGKEDRSVAGNSNPVGTTRTADQDKPVAKPEPRVQASIPQSDLNRARDNNTKSVENLPIGDANRELSSVPAVNENPAMPEVPANPAPDKPNSRLATVDAAKSPPMPDAAADFYSRSVIALLSMNDIDAAVDFYSRMDSDSISDQRLDLFLRLAVVANSYSLYREWLRECAETIPGGTSLKVGSENLPIAIVEASPALIIFRDRGVNHRYPVELVPNAVAWGVIDQMRPGEPLAPIIKPLAQYIKNWDRPEVIEESIAQISAFEPVDSVGHKAKQAVLGWLQTDHAVLLGAPGTVIDLKDARFTEALSQVAAKNAASEHSEEAIHEWILDAFLETDPLQRVARFEYAKRAAIEESNVSLALCLHWEVTRALDPTDANEENIKLIQELSSKVSEPGEGTRLLVHILRFVDESKKSLDASQVQAATRVASGLADRLKLDRFSDALVRAVKGD